MENFANSHSAQVRQLDSKHDTSPIIHQVAPRIGVDGPLLLDVGLGAAPLRLVHALRAAGEAEEGERRRARAGLGRVDEAVAEHDRLAERVAVLPQRVRGRRGALGIRRVRRAVVGFGGSYGGMVGAWFRIKYPNAVDGVVAASAPIWSFTGLDPVWI